MYKVLMVHIMRTEIEESILTCMEIFFRLVVGLNPKTRGFRREAGVPKMDISNLAYYSTCSL